MLFSHFIWSARNFYKIDTILKRGAYVFTSTDINSSAKYYEAN